MDGTDPGRRSKGNEGGLQEEEERDTKLEDPRLKSWSLGTRSQTSHEALLLEYEEALTRPVYEPKPQSFSAPPTRPGMSSDSRSNSHVRAASASSSTAASTGLSRSPVRPESFTPSSPVVPSPEHGAGDAGDAKYYNVSSHFIWIGDRTRQLDGAHVEYFRGIANPM